MDMEMVLDQNADVRKIDQNIKNGWKWVWLQEKNRNNDYLSTYMRKSSEAGKVFCSCCRNFVNYGSSGKKALQVYSQSIKHKKYMQNTKNIS